MKLQQIIELLEEFVPLCYQESYDNSGLILGSPSKKINHILLTLDITSEVIDEAIATKCELIIAHHPILFKPINKINGKFYEDEIIIKAIKNNIALYACHTNLDNMHNGVNAKIAQKLDLIDTQILVHKTNTLCKLITYVPLAHLQLVRQKLFETGAGHIGEYKNCSFSSDGKGTFKASNNATPFVGNLNELHTEAESKLEILFPVHLQSQIINTLHKYHPYQEVAYDIIALQNTNSQIGSGMIGSFRKPISEIALLKLLKQKFIAKGIRHTTFLKKDVQRIAVCGGSGSFLIPTALAQKVDAFITSDIKYHNFFEAHQKMLLIDLGHYESEQFTPEIFYEILSKKIPTFAIHFSKIGTNPIHYY